MSREPASATVEDAPSLLDREAVLAGSNERVARGKAARTAAPRSSHRRWEPADDRPDPVALLEAQAETRVPELVPIRYGRMMISPFAFYRGAALIMASDLAATPRSGLTVQLCGDAHLSNFGAFGSPERKMMFDINDFDETLPGPWEWDVKRLAASFEIAGRDRGFRPADLRSIVTEGVREYRETMRRAAGMPALESWYAHVDMETVMDWLRVEVKEEGLGKEREIRRAERAFAKARTRDSTRVFARLTGKVDGELRIVADPPLIVPIDDLVIAGTDRETTEAWIRSLVRSYRGSIGDQHHPVDEYRYVDTARKVVGVGSVGMRAWILLMVGRDEDPLFLQAKEAQSSVLERFIGKSQYHSHGQRVVAGQRLMQAASDIFLGWVRVEGLDGQMRDYYVRQLHDWKGSAEVDTMRVPGATLYARLCGSTLARAHARSGDRIAIASYLGKGDVFDQAIADFSIAYADQNERDFGVFTAAVNAGRLTAQTGL